MIKSIIVDDEPLARDIIKDYLKDYPSIAVTEECNNGFEGLKAIQQHQPDLVFLDIQMPKINGFEMLELIDNTPSLIFTTAFDEFAIKAFEKNAIDYLLKPFSKERFAKSIEKFMQKPDNNAVQNILEEASLTPSQQNRVVVKDGPKIKIIPISKIQYFEAADDYVKIICDDGVFLKNKTMAFYEKSLAPFHFVRIHRSYLVNTQLITRIYPAEKDAHSLLLSTGKDLPVSKSGYAKLKIALGI